MRVYQTPQSALRAVIREADTARERLEVDTDLGKDGIGAILEGEHSLPTEGELGAMAEVVGCSAGDLGWRGLVFVDRSAKPEKSHNRFVASTAKPDRAGDIVDQRTWKLDAFKSNPVIPWSHTYQIRPVGRADNVWVDGSVQQDIDETKNQPRLMTDVTWNMREGQFSEQVGKDYQDGFLHAGSVGFRPGESQRRSQLTEDHPWHTQGRGSVYRGNELMEFSACAVPMNGDAVAQRSAIMGRAHTMGSLEDMVLRVLANPVLLGQIAKAFAELKTQAASSSLPVDSTVGVPVPRSDWFSSWVSK